MTQLRFCQKGKVQHELSLQFSTCEEAGSAGIVEASSSTTASTEGTAISKGSLSIKGTHYTRITDVGASPPVPWMLVVAVVIIEGSPSSSLLSRSCQACIQFLTFKSFLSHFSGSKELALSWCTVYWHYELWILAHAVYSTCRYLRCTWISSWAFCGKITWH